MATKKTTEGAEKKAAKPAAKTAAKKAPAKAAKPAAETKPKQAAEATAKRTPSHAEIAAVAHRYWEERGRQHGSHVDDWLRAEKELKS